MRSSLLFDWALLLIKAQSRRCSLRRPRSRLTASRQATSPSPTSRTPSFVTVTPGLARLALRSQ